MAIDLQDIARGKGGFVIDAEGPADRSGTSVASAGDVNGDGFNDLIIGATGGRAIIGSDGYVRGGAGKSYVVFGRADGFGAVIDLAEIAAGRGGFVLRGERGTADRAGRSVASAGDVNGDGFDDVIIGASGGYGAGNAEPYAGDSYVVLGRAGGFPAEIDLGQVALGQGGFVIHGEDEDDRSGTSVTGAGDVNGDGFDDLIIGAYRADGARNAKSSAGSSYVVFGQAGGFASAIDLGQVALGQGGFVIHGEDAYDYSGWSVATAGDVNGDGFGDLIIGAPGGDAAGNAIFEAGDTYVVFGKAGGFGAAIDLTTIAAGSGGFVIHGEDAGDSSGSSVASAGDVDGDGFDDLIIGAPLGDAAGNGKDGAGDSYVVFGKAGGFGAAIELADVAAGQGGFIIHGQGVGDRSGVSVASAGDVNGDGFDDLIIGASLADAAGNASSEAGDSYVVFGKADFGTAIDLAAIARGRGGFVIHGRFGGDESGSSVASAGDVDGDGFDDLVIGAPNARRNFGAVYAGESYVIFGGPFLGSADPTLGTDAGERLDGTDGADAIDGGRGRDVVRGRQRDDTLAGGNGGDRLQGNAGSDLLAGGRGNDRLVGGNRADTLAGGQGEDVFRYRNADHGGDLILDFAAGTDAFEFSASGFGGGLTAGIDLGATGRFTANAAGTTTSAAGVGQIVFDTDDALLLWDADGTGGASAVLIATLDDDAALAAADLHVIA